MEIFEYINDLTTPYDFFYFDSDTHKQPYYAHWHHYMEILYIMDGSLRVDYDHTSAVLNNGDMIIIYPTVVHSLYNVNTNHLRYAVIKFNVFNLCTSYSYIPNLHSIFSSSKTPDNLIVNLKASQLEPYKIRYIVTQLIDEYTAHKFCYDISINSLLNILLISIARIWINNDINLKAIINSHPINKMNSILEYIDLHSSENLSVSELASHFNMSYSTFTRLFKLQTGYSCKEYIENIRINKAQNLIIFTNLSIEYIADEAGFNDCSHFIKTYKKLKGITPSKQRKLAMKECPPPDVIQDTVDKSHSS